MKLILSIPLVLLFSTCGQHKSSKHNLNVDCNEAKTHFKTDLDSGLIKLYLAGPKDFSDTYERLMAKNYDIEIIETNLFGIDQYMSCYNAFSEPYINSKYGDSIFNKTKILANKMDREGLGDSWPYFTTPEDSIRNYFVERIDSSLYLPYLDARNYLSIYASFLIDSIGTLQEIQLYSYNDTPLKAAFDSLVPSFPFTAVPALYDGNATSGLLSFHMYLPPIVIND